MTNKVSKEMVFGFYSVITLILTFSGYLFGKKTNAQMKYAGIGLTLGIALSAILWMTVGKKMVENDK